MSEPGPILAVWDGEAFVPLGPVQARRADDQYVVGERYRMAPFAERSKRSHDHYHACVQEAWKNLPAELADRFASSDHLRKWALIKCGYRDERQIVCDTEDDARKLAAFGRGMDGYAVIVVRANVVIIYTAQSQSMRAMRKAAFQSSKDAVLNLLSEMIGTDAASLSANTELAA